MQIMLFTGDTPEKILEGRKSMTARLWKRKPPKVGDIVRAQKGRKKETAFATLRIKNVFTWDGEKIPTFSNTYTNLSDALRDNLYPTAEKLSEIAQKEGFVNWDHFYIVYYKLNEWCWDEIDRTHWFIEFELVDTLDLEAPDPCK